MHGTDIFTKDEIIISGTQEFMGTQIPVVIGGFGDGRKCISDKTIAEIHGMNTFDVRRRITDNIKRFKEGTDFINLAKHMREMQTLKDERSNEIDMPELLLSIGYSKQSITQAENIYILSERGYAKLIKIMESDIAWEVHDRLMDEYFTYRDILQNISPELQAIIMHDKKIQRIELEVKEVNQDLQEFKRNLPLLPADADEVKAEVNKVAVRCLGRKESNAYKDKTLCHKVYWDIYNELKRQFEVSQYKYIRQCQKPTAVNVIRGYQLPIALKEQIEDCNAQMNISSS